MSGEVVVESRPPGRDWVRVGGVCGAEPCGSVSSDGPGGRQVYLFGFRDGRAGVWRSTAGYDTGTALAREVTTAGLVQLSDLAAPFELELVWDGTPIPVRFTLDPLAAP